MAMSCIAVLGGAGIGLYRLLVDDSYLSFFGPFALGSLVAVMISLRGHLDVLLPLTQRLDELKKATKAEHLPADASR